MGYITTPELMKKKPSSITKQTKVVKILTYLKRIIGKIRLKWRAV
jgi:hypothetical protein